MLYCLEACTTALHDVHPHSILSALETVKARCCPALTEL